MQGVARWFDRHSDFVEINGLHELTAALSRFPERMKRAIANAGREIGDFVRQEAKARAPISPTKKNHSKSLKRKRITAVRGHTPGGLEKSIRYEVLPNGDVSVFVPSNGYTRTQKGFNYAPRIHDERGTKWHNLGPGSLEKSSGRRVGEKFIQRARDENIDKIRNAYRLHLEKEIARL